MTLTEHLRELRHRMFVSAIAIAAASVIGWIFYEPIFFFLGTPRTSP